MISRFITSLDFRDLNHESPGTKLRLMLLAALIYDSARLAVQIIVPESFVTDLGSVPQFFWSLVPPIGKADRGYVLHDWLYQSGGRWKQGHVLLDMTRGDADAVLYEAMILAGVNKALAWTIYRGVRMGGWWSWRKYRQMEFVEMEAKWLHDAGL